MGLPVIERTIDLNPAVAGRISGDVLLWGDEAAVERLIRTRARLPVSVVLCSDLLYGDGPPEEKEPVAMGKDLTMKDGAAAAGGKREILGAAETLAITLSAVCSLSSATEETLILSCHERRWSGDQGAFFFELLARKGFSTIEAVNLGDIDERYRGDCGISLMRIRRE